MSRRVSKKPSRFSTIPQRRHKPSNVRATHARPRRQRPFRKRSKGNVMAQPELLRWDDSVDGALSESAMRKKLEALGYTVDRWVYAPGTVFDFHTHGVDKIDGVLKGRFKITMYGHDVILGP